MGAMQVRLCLAGSDLRNPHISRQGHRHRLLGHRILKWDWDLQQQEEVRARLGRLLRLICVRLQQALPAPRVSVPHDLPMGVFLLGTDSLRLHHLCLGRLRIQISRLRLIQLTEEVSLARLIQVGYLPHHHGYRKKTIEM